LGISCTEWSRVGISGVGLCKISFILFFLNVTQGI
jgi:hypothetical protein